MLIALTALALPALALVVAADDPDVVVATAPIGVQSVAVGAVAPVAEASPTVSLDGQTPHGLTTAQQIERWTAAGQAVRRPADPSRDPFAFDDRKMHAEAFAAVGTGDYTAFGARVSLPIGETGRLDLSYSESKNNPYGYGYGYGFNGRAGYDPRFGPAYRGHYDPEFFGEGVVWPGRTFRPWREREEAYPERETRTTATD